MKRYIKASYNENPYMQELSDYLDSLSGKEIKALSIYNNPSSEWPYPTIWVDIPSYLRDTVEKAVGLRYCPTLGHYLYQIEYRPDDDSIAFGIDTDYTIIPFSASEETESRFRLKFKKYLK